MSEMTLEHATDYINKHVCFGKQAEILLNFMENNKKAIDKHQNRSALLTIRDTLKSFITEED